MKKTYHVFTTKDSYNSTHHAEALLMFNLYKKTNDQVRMYEIVTNEGTITQDKCIMHYDKE